MSESEQLVVEEVLGGFVDAVNEDLNFLLVALFLAPVYQDVDLVPLLGNDSLNHVLVVEFHEVVVADPEQNDIGVFNYLDLALFQTCAIETSKSEIAGLQPLAKNLVMVCHFELEMLWSFFVFKKVIKAIVETKKRLLALYHLQVVRSRGGVCC